MIEARRVIRASCEHVFAYLARVEHLPRYGAPLWMAADAVEKRGTTQVIALSGYFAGLPVESVQRVSLRPPTMLEVSQVRGTLRTFSGRCTLQSGEDGTEVLYRLEVDPAIPMVTEDSARQFLVQYLGRLLDRIKLAAERKAPGRRAPETAATATAIPVLLDEDDRDAEPGETELARPTGREEHPEGPSGPDAAARTDAGEPVHAAPPPRAERAVESAPASTERSPG
ncbi:MAG TPA: SRPBCC family protein, partial [bacterium]|nr:SRPBCC family protein [bacterium]